MTSSAISLDDLTAQITSCGINPAATEYLAKVYYRRIAARLWKAGAPRSAGNGNGPAESSPGWPDPSWLHPRAVWTARGATTPCGPGERYQAFIAEVGRDLATHGPTRPVVEHLPDREIPPWVRESVRLLEQDVRQVDDSQSLLICGRLAHTAHRTVERAVDTLDRVWPEAAAEFRTLIRSIVYVEAQGFGSATVAQAFGAIYTSADYLGDEAAAFEMLLHETGHHSLYLRNSFLRFVTNGSDIASHPLRSDDRPIAGVVHSAQALARMATGLDRWARESGAPQEVRRRRDTAVQALAESLDVLRAKAEWTESGEKYFADLCACARQFGAPG